jgi:Spy/CpxP family protein refolding chaperone
MKRIAFTFLALISATSLFAQSADSSATDNSKLEPPPKQAAPKHSFWDRLNLTDDQKEQLKQIRAADRDSLGAAWAQVKITQESLHAALLANPENTEDIQAKATNYAKALSTKSVQWALHEAKVSQVLTPTQRVALDETLEHRKNHWRHVIGDSENDWRNGEHSWEKRNHSPRNGEAAPSPGTTPGNPE